MNADKKRSLQNKQRYMSVLVKNKKIMRVNILILSIGLALSYIGKEVIGEPLLWLGIIIFAYTTYSNITTRKLLQAQKGHE